MCRAYGPMLFLWYWTMIITAANCLGFLVTQGFNNIIPQKEKQPWSGLFKAVFNRVPRPLFCLICWLGQSESKYVSRINCHLLWVGQKIQHNSTRNVLCVSVCVCVHVCTVYCISLSGNHFEKIIHFFHHVLLPSYRAPGLYLCVFT